MMIMVTKMTKEHTIIVNILSLKIARLTKNQQIWAWKDWGMSGASSEACLGHHLGHALGIIWGIDASSGACLGHHLGHVWGIIWGMSGASSWACLGQHLKACLGHIRGATCISDAVFTSCWMASTRLPRPPCVNITLRLIVVLELV